MSPVPTGTNGTLALVETARQGCVRSPAWFFQVRLRRLLQQPRVPGRSPWRPPGHPGGRRRSHWPGRRRAGGSAPAPAPRDRWRRPRRPGRGPTSGRRPCEQGFARGRACRTRLRGGVDERAAPVARRDGRPRRGRRTCPPAASTGAPPLRLPPQLPGPDLVDPVEVGHHEVVLGREPLVEGRLGHPRLGDDPVDPDARMPWA